MTAGSPPEAGEDTPADGTTARGAPQDRARRDLFRYITYDEHGDYAALMRLFTSSLLTDLSAADAHEALRQADPGLALTVEDVEIRCRQLVEWGNLVPSVRDARVATVTEWLRSRSRYQASKLGGRVHRDYERILHASDGAREVARELLGGTVATLTRILAALEDLHAPPDPAAVEALAGDVTTVFNNQRLFSESATDFYAFVQSRLSRYDLGGPEYAQFKEMLLKYVDLISADVARHSPAVAEVLTRIEPHLPTLLSALDELPGLTGTDGEPAERSPGRSRADWDALTAWYTGRHGRSGPAQLRSAAEQALGQLIVNAKRMLAAAGTGVSRRADLLKLAGWFHHADTDTAHRLYDAAYGAYPARHLSGGPEEESPRFGATTSWWDADPVDVPLSLRERGDRIARGRSARVPDPAADRARLLAQAREEADRKRAAAAELCAAGTLHGARLSPAARDLLLDALGAVFAVHQRLEDPVVHTDTDTGLTVTVTPSAGSTRIHCPDGDLTVSALTLTAAALTAGTDTARDAAEGTA